MTVFEKINDFLVNTVLGQFSVIVNDMFFQKTSSNSMEKVICSIVFLYITSFKSILMWISVTVFEKINDFLANTVLGQVSVIANDMFFQKN